MTNDKKKKFDLEDRTGKFGEDIIEFAKLIPKNVITIPLIGQLIRAGTSDQIIAKQIVQRQRKILSIS